MNRARWMTLFAVAAMLAGAPALMADETVPSPAPAPVAGKVSKPGPAADQLDLDSTSIRGNQELPKVMYIVPWKESGLGELQGRPVNSLVDEVLAPVDRDVFRRQIRYFDQLYGPGKGHPNDSAAVVLADDSGS